MAHIHEHRPRRHDPYEGHIRRRPARGNGAIPGRRHHGGFGNSEAMAMGAGLERGMSGRGPKGYVRSTDRIRDDVCAGLIDDPHLDAGEIDVWVENGDVTLSGAVDSHRARRHAEDLAERVCGVKNVHSRLRVGRRPGYGGTL